MRTLRYLLLLLTVFACGVCAAANSQLTSVTSILGELRVGIVPGSIPFSYTASGSDGPVGHQVDLATQLAQDMGVQISFREKDFDSLVADLEKGNIDIVMAGTPMNARLATRVAFTRPWGRTGITPVALRTAAARFRGWNDFRPAQVRVGSSVDPVVRSFVESVVQGREVQSIDSSQVAIDALVGGGIDVYVTNIIEASVLNRIDERIVALFPEQSALGRPLACLVKIDDPTWLHYVNTWLTIKEEIGYLGTLARKWGLLGQRP